MPKPRRTQRRQVHLSVAQFENFLNEGVATGSVKKTTGAGGHVRYEPVIHPSSAGRPRSGRASRVAANTRTSGSRRSSTPKRSTSSSSDDDSGGSSSDDEGDGASESAPTLPEAFRALTGKDIPTGRRCACGCGGSIEHLAPQAKWLPGHQQRFNEEQARVDAALIASADHWMPAAERQLADNRAAAAVPSKPSVAGDKDHGDGYLIPPTRAWYESRVQKVHAHRREGDLGYDPSLRSLMAAPSSFTARRGGGEPSVAQVKKRVKQGEEKAAEFKARHGEKGPDPRWHDMVWPSDSRRSTVRFCADQPRARTAVKHLEEEAKKKQQRLEEEDDLALGRQNRCACPSWTRRLGDVSDITNKPSIAKPIDGTNFHLGLLRIPIGTDVLEAVAA